jgi:xylan 1,4-beta-xylosidase
MEMSHLEGGKPGFPKWNGIIQQYDARENRLVGSAGKSTRVARWGPRKATYLRTQRLVLSTTAEGGTFYNHGVTMARSRSLFGPYETDPIGQMMTSRYDCRLPLQRVGHADLFENALGEMFIVHLCGRPLPTKGRSPMGRETAIQRVYWNEEGWLRLLNERTTPESVVHTRLEERPGPRCL